MMGTTSAAATAKFPGQALSNLRLTWPGGMMGYAAGLLLLAFLACAGWESNSRNLHGKKPKREGTRLCSLDLHLHGKASPGWTV